MKESQAYPEGYGAAVFEYWKQWQDDLGDDEVSEVASSVSDTDYAETSTEHSQIDDACQALGVSTTAWSC